MKIVVIGCGKIGYALVKSLSEEGHEIVVIDQDVEAIEDIVSVSDVLGIHGHGANYDIQVEADVKNANLTIAVTNSDELNIVCCMMAKKMGSRHTIARVRNTEYFKYLQYMKEQLGLSLMLNPEAQTAIEISRILRFPSALKVEAFAKGGVDLIELKIKNDSPLIGLSLAAIYPKFKVKILVCTIKRDDEVFIPDGNVVLQENDAIYLTASKDQMQLFLEAIGSKKKQTRKVMIIGGGRIAYYLAKELQNSNVQITIIEQDLAKCESLSENLPFVTVIHGDGTDHELLDEEGLLTTDACVALTGFDEENVVISLYAESKNVHKVITKVSHIRLDGLLDSIGINCVVSSNVVSVNHITRYVRAMVNSKRSNSIVTLYNLVNNRVEAIEFSVTEAADYLDTPLSELKLKNNLLIASIIRNRKLIIPDGKSTIQLNDKVIVVTTNKYMKHLEEILEK